MRLPSVRVDAIPMPLACSLHGMYPRVDLSDSYAVALPPGTVHDPERLARCLFERPAPWMEGLMGVRDFAVSWFGLKTARALRASSGTASGERIGIFKVYFRGREEILLGEDDRHLDFRISILLQVSAQPEQAATLVMSTVVHCHNRLGHVYLTVIAPFHRLLARATLRRAAQAGWPSDASREDDGAMAAA
jgi:hypothetical protein